MSRKRDVTFRDLCREFPVQTGLMSVGPVVLAFAQLLNGYYHETVLSFHALFALVMMAFAVLATQYNLAAFRVQKLERGG